MTEPLPVLAGFFDGPPGFQGFVLIAQLIKRDVVEGCKQQTVAKVFGLTQNIASDHHAVFEKTFFDTIDVQSGPLPGPLLQVAVKAETVVALLELGRPLLKKAVLIGQDAVGGDQLAQARY